MSTRKPFGDREALNSLGGCCGAPDDPLGAHEIHDPSQQEPLWRDTFVQVLVGFIIVVGGLLWWSLSR